MAARFRIPLPERRDDLPWPLYEAQEGRPAYIEVPYWELEHALTRLRPEQTWLAVESPHQGVVETVTQWDQVPEFNLRLPEGQEPSLVNFWEFPDETARTQMLPLLEGLGRALEKRVILMGHDQPFFRPAPGFFLLQEAPLLPYRFRRYKLFNWVGVTGYTKGISQLRPYEIGGKPLFFSGENALVSLFAASNAHQRAYLLDYMLQQYLQAEHPERLPAYQEACRRAFQEAYVGRVPEWVRLQNADVYQNRDWHEETIRYHQQEIQRLLEEQRTQIERLVRTRQFTDPQRLEAEAARLAVLPQIRLCYPAQNGFRVMTEPLLVEHNGQRHVLGTYQIELARGGRGNIPTLRVNRLEGTIQGYEHPNVNNGGFEGRVAQEIIRKLTNFDYCGAVETALQHLQAYHPIGGAPALEQFGTALPAEEG